MDTNNFKNFDKIDNTYKTEFTVDAVLHELWSHVIGYSINGEEWLGIEKCVKFIKENKDKFTNATVDEYGHIRISNEATIEYRESVKVKKRELLGIENSKKLYTYENGNVKIIEDTFITIEKLPPFLLYCKGVKTVSMVNCFSKGIFHEWNGDMGLEGIIDLTLLDTHNIENMESMFNFDAEILDSYLYEINMSNLNVKKVKNMRDMFRGAKDLERLKIDNWSTESLVDTSGMFYYCEYMEEVAIEQLNVSKVKNMHEMFAYTGFKTLKIEKWMTENLIDASEMFNCASIEKLDLSNWVIKNLENTIEMFSYATELEDIKLFNCKTNSIKETKGMFEGCFLLKNIDLSNFEVKNLKDASDMFCECKSLESVGNLDNCDTTNINTTDMFYKCKKLLKLPVWYKSSTKRSNYS